MDIFLAKDGWVPILREMTGSAMPPVEANDVCGQQPAHHCCDRYIAGLLQQIKMIPYQTPGIIRGMGLVSDPSQPIKKIIAICVIREDDRTFHPHRHTMVPGAWGIYSGCSPHAQSIPIGPLHVNAKR
jgi:hypothetical protein